MQSFDSTRRNGREASGRRYIVPTRWHEFQHYRDRDPKWIKSYTRLLDDEAYLNLTGTQRAVLHGLWLAFAKTHGKVPLDTRWLSRYLALRVTKQTLDTLNEAGFIEVSASSCLAQPERADSPEAEKEKEKEAERAYRPVSPCPNNETEQATTNGSNEGESHQPSPEIRRQLEALSVGRAA